jgi:hypothetical protein
VRDSGDVGPPDRLVLEREAAQRLEDDRPLVGGEPHADPLRSWSHTASRLHCGNLLRERRLSSAAVFLSTSYSGVRLVSALSAAVAPDCVSAGEEHQGTAAYHQEVSEDVPRVPDCGIG